MIVIGLLFLIDRVLGFSRMGLGWVMQQDNLILYTAVIFLIFKRDKSVGLVLLGIWLVLNIGFIIGLLGQLSGYLLPITLLLIGAILYIVSVR